MATVDASLPRATEISVVDAKELWGEGEPPAVSPKTGMPLSLRAFVVCSDPRVTVVPHCLSDAECDHVLSLVEGNWTPSTVGVTEANRHRLPEAERSQENRRSESRTSWSCQMRYLQTDVVERLEHRLASVAGLPVTQLERLNLVRYAPGQLFNEHHDGKFRPRTVFVYLNDLQEDDEGGDTFFPVLGLSFRPRRGTAVVWSNALPSGKEDSRMLHAGRPPCKGTKYGVNCFFNDQEFRAVLEPGKGIPFDGATVVRVGDLGDSQEQANCSFRCLDDPKVVAKPSLLTADEVEHLLSLATKGAGTPWDFAGGPFEKSTRTIRVLEAQETAIVEGVELKIVGLCGSTYDYMARLRVVQTATESGLCNRGSGQISAYVCLHDSDEVWFPKLGLRFEMRRGDALYWTNTKVCEGRRCEDLRTQRVHLGGRDPGGSREPVSVVGLDAFFHDNPVRDQQRQQQDCAVQDVAS